MPSRMLFLFLLSSCATSHHHSDLSRLLENKDATFQVDALPGGHGSGSVLNAEGDILTCLHVSGSGDQDLQLTIAEADGQPVPYKARVVAIDPKMDLAVIHVDRRFEHPVILADADAVHEGDLIYNVGFPYDFGKQTGRGYVMRLHYDRPEHGIWNAIVADIIDGPGTSGSGVFSVTSGKLVAVMKMMVWGQAPRTPPTVIRMLTSVEDVRKFLDAHRIAYRTAPKPGEDWTVPMAARPPVRYVIGIVPAAPRPQIK